MRKIVVLFSTLLILLTGCTKETQLQTKTLDTGITVTQQANRPIVGVSPLSLKITKTCSNGLYENGWLEVRGLKFSDHLVASYIVNGQIISALELPIIYEGNVGYSYGIPTLAQGCVGFMVVRGTVGGIKSLASMPSSCIPCFQ